MTASPKWPPLGSHTSSLAPLLIPAYYSIIKTVTQRIKETLTKALRWSERYTKTDMVYLVQAGVWTNLGVITSTAMGLLLSIAFANLLPKEVYGTYQYLLSLSALVAAVCLGGMQQAVAQSVARGNEGDVRAALRAQLKWNLVPAALALAGAAYYALHGNSIVAAGLVIVGLFTPLTSAFSIYGALLGGTRQFKRFFFYSFMANLAYYAAIFAAMILFKVAVVLVFVNLAVNAAATTYFYYRTLRVCEPNEKTDPHTVSYGAHLSVMNAFGTVISQLDSILVFHFLGAAQLAVYSFATLIPERGGAFLSFIGTAAFPKYSQRTLAELRGSIVSQTWRAAALGAAVALVYAALAPLLFHLLFPKYLDALSYTQLYAPVIALMAANLVSSALVSQRLKTELYLTSFINPLMLITLQVPLLLLYGIWGMLVARMASDLVGILLGLALLLKKRTS
jgi:O-antigen/teichoic acid export membrane protein